MSSTARGSHNVYYDFTCIKERTCSHLTTQLTSLCSYTMYVCTHTHTHTHIVL